MCKELRVTVNASQVVAAGEDAEYSVFLLQAGVLQVLFSPEPILRGSASP